MLIQPYVGEMFQLTINIDYKPTNKFAIDILTVGRKIMNFHNGTNKW